MNINQLMRLVKEVKLAWKCRNVPMVYDNWACRAIYKVEVTSIAGPQSIKGNIDYIRSCINRKTKQYGFKMWVHGKPVDARLYSVLFTDNVVTYGKHNEDALGSQRAHHYSGESW